MVGARAIDHLVARMAGLLEPLAAAADARAYFLATYLRMTEAVAADLSAGAFGDPAWTERWDITFASLYLDALEQWSERGTAPGPWRVAFTTAAAEQHLPPLRHVLLGMNAHVNYDLPQALLAVIPTDEFDDPGMIALRRADHARIDDILAARVRAEDRELRKLEQPGDRTTLDRMLTPFTRRAARRFLAEARAKVWRNAVALDRARRDGTLAARLAELEVLSSRRVADLCVTGQVLLRLARRGFGVELTPGRAVDG